MALHKYTIFQENLYRTGLNRILFILYYSSLKRIAKGGLNALRHFLQGNLGHLDKLMAGALDFH